MADKKDKKDSVSKSWFAVFNNPSDHGYIGDPKDICERLRDEWISSSPTRSGAWVFCISSDGLPHVHMVLEDIKSMRFSVIKKSYALGMHFEPTLGTKLQAEDYIYKRGSFEEKGEQIVYTCIYGDIKGNQGRRNDLHHLYDMVKDGLSTFDILEENPEYIKRINDIEKVRETIRYEQFKNVIRDVHVEYWWGQSGSGKTSGIYALYDNDYSKVYRVTDYRNPWDGYKGQDVVLFEEFHSDVEIGKMLVWLDRYPLELPCRYNNKTACYTKVYITSNEPLLSQYKYIQHDAYSTWEAFERRIHCIKEFDKDGLKSHSGLSIDKDGFLIPDQNIQERLPF